MDYLKFKKIKQNAVNKASFNKFIFWAFNNEQFEEGVQKTNAKKKQTREMATEKNPCRRVHHARRTRKLACVLGKIGNVTKKKSR